MACQAYLFFFDKLNKANYYLELSIEHSHLPIDDRLVYHLAGDLISDGGQWDMVVNLLEVNREYCEISEVITADATFRPTVSSRELSIPNPTTRRSPAL